MSMAAAANYGGRLVHALPEREAPPHVTRIAYPQQSPYAQQGLLQTGPALREPPLAYMGGHNPHTRVQTGGYGQVRPTRLSQAALEDPQLVTGNCA